MIKIYFLSKIIIFVIIILFVGFYGKNYDFSTYSGEINHYRKETTEKSAFQFKYKIKYDYFNLINPPYSLLAYYKRSDYIGPNNINLNEYIITSIKDNEKKEYLGIDCIKVLGNIRSYFYCFNPICLYYCYNENKLNYIFIQVSNIPWKEQTGYIIKIDKDNNIHEKYIYHKKKMHVSPFNPTEGQMYEFKINKKNLNIKLYNASIIEDINNKNLVMNIQLTLNKDKFTYFRLPRNHITVFRIYIQALFLYLKKYRYFIHR